MGIQKQVAMKKYHSKINKNGVKMLPELLREEKTIDFYGKTITIKKMMLGDSIELGKIIELKDGKEEKIKEFMKTLTNAELDKLTTSEFYRLYLEIAEYTNGHGLEFRPTCNNDKCILKSPFKVEFMVKDIEFDSISKQTIEIDDMSFNIVREFNVGGDSVDTLVKSVIYNGKLYKFENGEQSEFFDKYVTMDQYNELTSSIKLEHAIVKYQCPACGKKYEDDIINLDFFQ